MEEEDDEIMDYHRMKRKQLQALCKRHGVSANLSNHEMADRLCSILKESKKLVSQGESLMKNSSKKVTEKDIKFVKKVKFSQENQTIIYEVSGYKRAGRRRATMEPSSKKYIQAHESEVLSPPVGRKRARSDVTNDTVEVKVAVECDGNAVGGLIVRHLRTREVVVGNGSGDLAVTGKKVTLKDSKVATNQVSEENITFGEDVKLEKFKIGGRITRSRAQFIGEASENGEVQRKCEGVDQLEGPCKVVGRTDRILRHTKRNVTKDEGSEMLRENSRFKSISSITGSQTKTGGAACNAEIEAEEETIQQKGLGRYASRRKSVVRQKGNLGSDGRKEKKETRKRSTDVELEGTSELEVIVEPSKEIEMFKNVVIPNGPSRRTRSQKFTVSNDGDLETQQNVGEKDAHLTKKHPRRSSRNVVDVAEPDEILQQKEQNITKDEDSETLSRNTRKFKGISRITTSQTKTAEKASAFENETLEETVQLEEPSKVLGKNASRRKSVVLQKRMVENDEIQARKETRKGSSNNDLERVSELEAVVEPTKELEMLKNVSILSGPSRRTRRNTVMFKSTASIDRELESNQIVGQEDAYLIKDRKRSSRTDSSNHSPVTSSEEGGISHDVGKVRQQKRRRDPALDEDTSVSKSRTLAEKPPRRSARNASKGDLVEAAGPPVKVAGKKHRSGSIIPIMVQEVPSSDKLSAPEEPIIEDVRSVGRESAKNKNKLEANCSKNVLHSSNKKRKASGTKFRAKLGSDQAPTAHYEEKADDAAVNLENSPGSTLVKLSGVSTDQGTLNSASKSTVVLEECSLVGGDKLVFYDIHEGDKDDTSCRSLNRISEFGDSNPAEPEVVEIENNVGNVISSEITSPAVGLSPVNQSNNLAEPSNFMDLGKVLEAEEPSIGKNINHGSKTVGDLSNEDVSASVKALIQLEDTEETIAEPVIQEVVFEEHLNELSRSSLDKQSELPQEAEEIHVIDPSDEGGNSHSDNFLQAIDQQELAVIETGTGRTAEIQLTSGGGNVPEGTLYKPALGNEEITVFDKVNNSPAHALIASNDAMEVVNKETGNVSQLTAVAMTNANCVPRDELFGKGISDDIICRGETSIGKGISDQDEMASQVNETAGTSLKEIISKECEVPYKKAVEKMMKPAQCIGELDNLKVEEFKAEDRNSDARVIDVSALSQVAGNHLAEEEATVRHDGSVESIGTTAEAKTRTVAMKRMDFSEEADNGETLVQSSPVTPDKTFISEFEGIDGPAPGCLNEVITANCKGLEMRSNIVSTSLHTDEAKFGDLDNYKEESVLEMEMTASLTSDNLISMNGRAADKKENVETTDAVLNFKNSCGDAENEDNVNSIQHVTKNNMNDHLLEVGLFDASAKIRVAADEAGEVSMNENVCSQIIEDDTEAVETPIFSQTAESETKWNLKDSAEGKLFADTSFGKPEMGSRTATASHLSALPFSASGVTDMDSPFELDDQAEKETILRYQKDNEGSNHSMEGNARICNKQLDDHKDALLETASIDVTDGTSSKEPSRSNRLKSIAKVAQEGVPSEKLCDMVDTSDIEKLYPVSSLTPKLTADCSTFSPVIVKSNYGITENKSSEFHIDSPRLTSWEMNRILGSREQVDVEATAGKISEVVLMAQDCEGAVEMEENLMINEQVDQQVTEKHLYQQEHHTHPAVSDELICDNEESEEHNGSSAINLEHIDCEIDKGQFAHDDAEEAEDIAVDPGVFNCSGSRGFAADMVHREPTRTIDTLEDVEQHVGTSLPVVPVGLCPDCENSTETSPGIAGTILQHVFSTGQEMFEREVHSKDNSDGAGRTLMFDEDRRKSNRDVALRSQEDDEAMTGARNATDRFSVENIVRHAVKTEKADGLRGLDDEVVAASDPNQVVNLENMNVASISIPEIAVDCSSVSPPAASSSYKNTALDVNAASHIFTSHEMNLLLEPGEQGEIENSDAEVLETNLRSEDAREVKENAMIMEQVAPQITEEQLCKPEMGEEDSKLKSTLISDLNEPPCESGKGSIDQEDALAIIHGSPNDKNHKNESPKFESTNLAGVREEMYECEVCSKGYSNGAERTEMFDEDRAKSLDVALHFQEDNEATRGESDTVESFSANDNARDSQEILEEFDEHKIAANEATSCANKSTGETDGLHYLDDEVITAEDSKEEMNLENMNVVSTLIPEIAVNSSAVSPLDASAKYENKALEVNAESHIFSSRNMNLFLEPGEHVEIENSDAEALETNLISKDATEVKENAIIMEQATPQIIEKQRHESEMAKEDSKLQSTILSDLNEPTCEIGKGATEQEDALVIINGTPNNRNQKNESLKFESTNSAAARGTSAGDAWRLEQSLLSPRNKNSPNAKTGSKTSFTKKLNSSMRKQNNRSALIQRTPKLLVHDMKENVLSTKRGKTGNVTAQNPLSKRRALEDLRKK